MVVAFKKHAFLNSIFFTLAFCLHCFVALAALSGEDAKPAINSPYSLDQTSATIDFAFLSLFAQESRLDHLREQALGDSDTANARYQLIIEANIPRFSVRVNGADYSGNPVRIKDLPSGIYSLRFHQDGYKDLELKLKVRSGMQYLMAIELAPRTGAILINADREIGSLEIDGDPVDANKALTLSQGQHRVRARCFGWQDYSQSVNVNEDMLTSVTIHFAPASFTIQGLSSSRSLFRPANPGRLGTSTLSFEVSAPGTGRISIIDPTGAMVLSQELPEFQTWIQEFVWNGRDDFGDILPEGIYTWRIEASPLPSVAGVDQTQTAHVTIDNSSFIKFRPNLAGSPGMGLAGEAYTLAQGAFQADFRLAWLPPDQAFGQQDAAQFNFGFRVGLIKNLELVLGATGSAYLGNDGLATALAGGQITWAALPLPAETAASSAAFGLSLNLGGAAAVSDSSPMPYRAWANNLIPGGHLGAAAQLRLGAFSVVLEPLLFLSPWSPVIATMGVGTNQKLPSAQATFFGSLNAGLYLDFDRFAAGISASLRTDATFSPSLPIPLAVAIQLMPFEGFVIGIDATEYLGTPSLSPPSIGLTIGLIQ